MKVWRLTIRFQAPESAVSLLRTIIGTTWGRVVGWAQHFDLDPLEPPEIVEET